MKKIITSLVLVLSINIFAADKVLYCTEIGKVGFEPKKNYEQTTYTKERFTVKVNFEKKSFISESIYFADYMDVTCEDNYRNEMICSNFMGNSFKLLQGGSKFIRTSIVNPDSIFIAHGNCEKF